MREDPRRTGAIDRFGVAEGFRIFLIVFAVLIVSVDGAGQNDEDSCLEYVGGSVSCEKRPVSGREELKRPTDIRDAYVGRHESLVVVRPIGGAKGRGVIGAVSPHLVTWLFARGLID